MDTDPRAHRTDRQTSGDGPADPLAELLRGPGEIAEDEAGGLIADTYAQLRESLGITFVPTAFRMLARHERYFATVVPASLASVIAPKGRRAVETMRAAGAQLPAMILPCPLRADAPLAAQRLIGRYNDANPPGLLMIRTLARGLPQCAGVMEPPPAPEVEDLLQDIRRAHGGVTVPGLWRELHGRWPSLAAAGWAQVRELVDRDQFHAARARVIAIANDATAAVTVPSPDGLAENAEEATAIKRILGAFQTLIPTMIVEIEWLRAALMPVVDR